MPAMTHHPVDRSVTSTISIPAAPTALFAFLADPTNLPLWAVGFAYAIRRDGERWIVRTNQGEIEVTMPANPQIGTIDFHMLVAPGVTASAYSRVLPNGAGSEYVFTQFQASGMSDEVFGSQVQALIEELSVLRGVMAARAACRRERPSDE